MRKLVLEVQKTKGITSRVPKGQDYYIYIGYKKGSYYFTNLKKAEKFLVSYQGRLQSLFDDFTIYQSEAYTFFVESINYLSPVDIRKLRLDFDNMVSQLIRINSVIKKSTGFYTQVNQYIYTIIDVLSFYKEFFKKRRFNALAKRSRYLLRQAKFSISTIEDLIINYKPFMVEIDKNVPIVTMGINNQLKIVS
jgi:hypothetical protein